MRTSTWVPEAVFWLMSGTRTYVEDDRSRVRSFSPETVEGRELRALPGCSHQTRMTVSLSNSVPPRLCPCRLGPMALISIGLLLPLPGLAQTILNVERLQPGDVSGWHWGIEGEFSFKAGNTESIDILSGVAAGHRWERDWLRVFVGLDYSAEGEGRVQNDRYLHIRYNHWFADRLQSFHFAQMQASRTALLERRFLLGSGLRYRFVDGRTTFDLGSGAMREWETLDEHRIKDDHPADAEVWRMANLAVATHRFSETLRLVAVAYIQPDLAAFRDLRALTDLSLQIALTERVDLTIRGEWRHDSRPPGGVQRNDLVMRSGFAVSFR